MGVTKAQRSPSSIQFSWPRWGIRCCGPPPIEVSSPFSSMTVLSPVCFLLLSFVCDSLHLPTAQPCVVPGDDPISLLLFPHVAFRAIPMLHVDPSQIHDTAPSDPQSSRLFWIFSGYLKPNFLFPYFSEGCPPASIHYPSNWPLKTKYSGCSQPSFVKQPLTKPC